MVSSARPPKVIPFSWSSLQSYETCPWRHYLTRISKEVQEEQGPALIEGNATHKALEDACKGTRPLPPEYVQYQPIVDRFTRAPGQKLYEFQFAVTASLAPCDYWDRNCWTRGKFDVAQLLPEVANVFDHKTGKRKVDSDQLRLSALAAFATWPHVQTVNTGYIWLQGGTMDMERYVREDMVEIHQDFAARAHRMEVSLQRNEWEKRPSGLCRQYCPVGRARCEHCGD